MGDGVGGGGNGARVGAVGKSSAQIGGLVVDVDAPYDRNEKAVDQLIRATVNLGS